MIPEHISADRDGLTVVWEKSGGSGSLTRTFPWFWVRDHGEDDNSLDAHTRQRKIDTFAIDSDIRASAASLDRANGLIRIDWPGTETTEITTRRLAQAAALELDATSLSSPGDKTYWMAGSMPEPVPTISYEVVMESEKGILAWLELIENFGFAVVSDTVATEEATVELAKRIAPAQRTVFGTYWPLSAEIKDHKDSAYTTRFLSPHTDNTYYHNAAGLQMFNCIEFDGKGGESVVVDGFALARKMQRENPELYRTLTRVMVPAQYIEPGVHLAAERPMFRHNGKGDLTQVSFNNYDRAPFLLEPDEMKAFYEAYAEFNRLAMDQENWCKIPLRPGTALIFNNWRCLHGRMSYVGKRYFYGCYHNHADYESRLRILRAQT